MGTKYRISSIGLSTGDLAALERLLLLSSVRDHVYCHVKDYRDDTDIVIVNADDPQALQLAQAHWGALDADSDAAPVLAFASAEPAAISLYLPILLHLPIRGSRIIHLLDRLADSAVDGRRRNNVIFSRDRFERRREENQAARRAARQPAKCCVLLLLDPGAERERMKSILLARGMIPVVASDQRAALEIFDRRRIDLVYVAAAAAGIDGDRFCRQVRQSPRTRAIPVIVLTDSREPAPGDGRAGALARPVSSTDFNRSLIEFSRGRGGQCARPRS